MQKFQSNGFENSDFSINGRNRSCIERDEDRFLPRDERHVKADAHLWDWQCGYCDICGRAMATVIKGRCADFNGNILTRFAMDFFYCFGGDSTILLILEWIFGNFGSIWMVWKIFMEFGSSSADWWLRSNATSLLYQSGLVPVGFLLQDVDVFEFWLTSVSTSRVFMLVPWFRICALTD
ncbi:hypothetical protein L5515_013656 [Caenorhabditis briggsae]|uniref:Uncharacterized protein n=1 Tax=Caenorhabditis briggsae TaxID=6238 RepID=A0AAE9E8W9_CAEBR|nr:hypothetical protein L5515_013656 [Caenorhabditis briggsae]